MAERIIYVSHARIPTTAAHGLQVMSMCSAFAAAGREVVLIVPQKRNIVGEDPFIYYDIAPTFRIEKIWIPDFGSRSVTFAYLRYVLDVAAFILALLREHETVQGDIIYCRDFWLLFLFPSHRNTLVIEVHDIPRWRILFRAALRRARRVVAITEGLRADLAKLGIDANKIIVAPDAVRLEDFAQPQSREDSRARLGLPLDKKIVMYIGKIDAWKGTDTLFQAATLLPDNVLTVVIGQQGHPPRDLEKEFLHVRFLGHRPYRELADNMAATDVLVLPNSGRFDISARYTSPLKLFAYMASGKPIVATDLPSIREVLDERAAYLVTPDDPQALADGIATALSADKSRPSRARELVQSYTWDERVRRILASITE